jgi:hypothetical protein
MSTDVKLQGVPKVTAAIRLLVTRAKNADVVARRILEFLARESKALQKARNDIDSATPTIDKALEAVAASYDGDLPDDGDWTEVMSRVEDGDPIRELADLQEAMETIVQEFSGMNIQGWIEDLEDLELPIAVHYDDGE